MSNISSWLSHNSLIQKVFATCLRAHQNKLYYMSISSSSVSRTTLSQANERRDWSIYADFAQSLIRTEGPLYANEDLGIDLVNTIYALDASTIELCLSVFPWALFRSTKSAAKLHTLLDLRGNIRVFIHISKASCTMSTSLTPFSGTLSLLRHGQRVFGVCPSL